MGPLYRRGSVNACEILVFEFRSAHRSTTVAAVFIAFPVWFLAVGADFDFIVANIIEHFLHLQILFRNAAVEKLNDSFFYFVLKIIIIMDLVAIA